MVVYSIYWVKEEVVKNYFHKSELLFRFFKEYEQYQHRSDLINQYHYITYTFPKEEMQSLIRKHLKKGFQLIINDSYLEIFDETKYISLHIGEKRLKFQSESLQDAEEILFPVFRLFHPDLFVVGNTFQNYGWISPIKTVSFHSKDKQVLYSCD